MTCLITLKKKIAFTACAAALYISLPALAQQNNQKDSIRLNQIGFYPAAPKKAVILNAVKGTFYIENTSGKKVFTGNLQPSAEPAFNGRTTGIADFSSLKTAGTYHLTLPGKGNSYDFVISTNALKPVADGAIKGYYFIRVSTPIEEKYAGKWHRAEGHPDNHVLIHASAVSATRPEGTVISSPGGWYDAGDYNKYIVNSGISTYTLLSLYEDFPAYMQQVNLNIPESSNQIPDVLDEALYNLRWMLTMQDPADGGVYHKLTNANFDPFIMPDKAVTPRYVIMKTTAATLDFAAVMAQASRIFAKFSHQSPGLADSCKRAAVKAWSWAHQNPAILYEQDAMNKQYSPKITTGAYGDRHVEDEFTWAAAELYILTHDAAYLPYLKIADSPVMGIPSWSDVKMLGYYSLLRHASELKNIPAGELSTLKQSFLNFASTLINGAEANAYETVINKDRKNFIWGSNSVAGNQGVALIMAYQLSGNQQYLNAAISNMDYLLGHNGTGYCYLTGFGHKPVMHPHHRPSVADGIVDPVPGLLAGGPNPGRQDKIATPSQVPDEAYIDDDRAYAVNEIAINWNAPFAYLANALQAIESHHNIKK